MAKKSTKNADSSSRERRDLTKFCAFWGIVIASLLFVVGSVFSLFEQLKTVAAIMDVCGKVALLIAVGLPAYAYVNGKAKAWRFVFWVAFVIYTGGVVFGLFLR